MWIEHLRQHAQRQPDRPAVVGGQRRLTYRDLYESVLALGGRLRAAGVREGDFVCVLLPNGADFVVSFFAIAAVRGIAVTLDPALSARERERYLGNVVPAAVVTVSALQSQGPAGRPVLLVDEQDPAPPLEPGLPFDGPVLCQFSSGSTGLPKRVVRTQRHLIREYRQLAGAVALEEDDVVAAVVPLHHAHGFGNALLLAIGNGLRLVIPSAPEGSDGKELPLRFWRSDLLALLEAEGVTILPAVPFMFGLLAEVRKPPAGLNLRLCISAGSAVAGKTQRRFRERFGVPIRQLYGCTEAGSVTFNASDDMDLHWESVGKPLPGVELRLEGEEGVVAFRSGALCDGYHDSPPGGDEAFRDGWFRPGDLGRLDAEGRLHILGRRRPFINSGGYKVDPLEVEQILGSHPDVAEAIAFGVPHPVLEEVVKAVVVPRPGVAVTEQALGELCRDQLAGHKRPRLLEIRDTIPRSPLGKVLVRELM